VRVPTLILDVERAEANLDRILARARNWGVRFRPHFKTHQSADVAALFRERGVAACTVSSVRMAEYFADHGWDDITIAVPLNLRELDGLRRLATRVRLGVLVDSLAGAAPLMSGDLPDVAVWIKVDCGYGRTGVWWESADAPGELAGVIDAAGGIELAGVLTHAGLSYAEASPDAVRMIHRQSLSRVRRAREAIAAVRRSGARLDVSVGDTPTASLAESMEGVDEIRPGNFIFYDLMQFDIGSCRDRNLAVAVACPIIGVYSQRGEIVVYCGAVHLSMAARADGTFGCLVEPGEHGLDELRPDAPVVRLSQEHGIIRGPADIMERSAVGDIVLISPVHSCLTAALYDHYLTLDGRRLGRM